MDIFNNPLSSFPPRQNILAANHAKGVTLF